MTQFPTTSRLVKVLAYYRKVVGACCALPRGWLTKAKFRLGADEELFSDSMLKLLRIRSLNRILPLLPPKRKGPMERDHVR